MKAGQRIQTATRSRRAQTCRLVTLLFSIIISRPVGRASAFPQVSRAPAGDCAVVWAALAENPTVADVDCLVSRDLTTANDLTTPPDNSLPGLPPGAFTPRTDANNQVSVDPDKRYPITMEVPGLQI